MERLAKDKHSSLLLQSVNYGCKKFYIASPCTYFSHKLQYSNDLTSLPVNARILMPSTEIQETLFETVYSWEIVLLSEEWYIFVQRKNGLLGPVL